MPKIKTNRAAAKRYAHTGTGKLKRKQQEYKMEWLTNQE